MRDLNKPVTGLIFAALFLFQMLPVQAQTAEEMTAKQDLEHLYTSWRNAKPGDPKTFNAFRIYLEYNRQTLTLMEMMQANVQRQPLMKLSTGWVVTVSKPQDGLMSFQVDPDGPQSKAPVQFLMDEQGKVEVQP